MKKLLALLLAPLIAFATSPLEILYDGEPGAPCILFLHGAGMKHGASDFSPEVFRHWHEKGFATAAISLPGFGKSEGVRDFCGPQTMEALHNAIDTLRANYRPPVLGVIGFGQGGLAALLLTGQRGDLTFAVVANSGYKLGHLLDPDDPFRQRIIRAGFILDFTEEELEIRSPMAYLSQMRTPLFLLHRHGNPVVKDEEVELFSEYVNRFGGECVLAIVKEEGHREKITHEQLIREAEEWILYRSNL